LRQLVDEKVQREGLVGVAIVGGLAVAAGVLGGLMARGMKKR
jgi:fission 1 protein